MSGLDAESNAVQDYDDLLRANAQLRSQLTQAREALERLAKVDPFDEADLPFVNASGDLGARIQFADQALATINEGNET